MIYSVNVNCDEATKNYLTHMNWPINLQMAGQISTGLAIVMVQY